MPLQTWFDKLWRREPPVDAAVIRAQVAAELREEMASQIERVRVETATTARAQFVDELHRALVTTPLPPVPDVNHRPPFGAYAIDRPITYSTPQAPTKRPGTPVTTDTLRALADNCDILRAAINHLKREVTSVPILIVPRDPKSKKNLKPAGVRRLEEARALFTKSGPIGGFCERMAVFESKMIEDLCVIGATAIFHQKAIGGWLRQSKAIDAATIRPFIDGYGWAPEEGTEYADQVYEQWIYGVQAAVFGRDDLTYDGIFPTTTGPYFKSPVEWIIDTVDTALRSRLWNKGWLTDGNSPDQILALPAEWTPTQVMQFAEYWDSLTAVGQNARHKTRFLPGGSGQVGQSSRKDGDFAAYDMWLLRIICSILGVQPASIGFAGEQYKVSQDESMDQTTAFGAGVLLRFRKDTYDDLLERYGFDEFESVDASGQTETAQQRAATNEILIRSGQRTINEVRKADGEDPIANGDTPLVLNTLIALEEAIAPTPAPPAAAPADDAEPNDSEGDDDTTSGDSADDTSQGADS